MWGFVIRQPKGKHDQRTTFIDRCFKDRDGHVLLVQLPNAPLITWAFARLVSWPLHGSLKHAAQILAFGALFTWAWLELFQGVNYFRRALGLVVLWVVIFLTGDSLTP